MSLGFSVALVASVCRSRVVSFGSSSSGLGSHGMGYAQGQLAKCLLSAVSSCLGITAEAFVISVVGCGTLDGRAFATVII